MKSSFSLDAKVLIGLCAVVDAASILVLATGTNTVQKCGAGWMLAGLEMIVFFSLGTVPIAIALGAVGLAALIPQLRSGMWWVVSAGVFSALAVGTVVVAAQRFPVPSDPIVCVI